MAHSKQARKRVRQNARNQLRNQAVRARMRTYVKKALEAVEAKDANEATAALRTAYSEIDRAARKGVIHPNNAARKKSMLARIGNAS